MNNRTRFIIMHIILLTVTIVVIIISLVLFSKLGIRN